MARSPSLEDLVLDTLAEQGNATVREILDAMDSGHAYTTILTVLDRLHRKKMVHRTKDGNAWRYRATQPRSTRLGRAMAELLSGVGDQRDSLLVAFLDQTAQIDPDSIERLEELLRLRRNR